MGEKIVNWDAFRTKVQSTGQGLYSNTKTKIDSLGKKVADVTLKSRSKVVNTLLSKGITITEKQLHLLKNVKEKTTTVKTAATTVNTAE